MYIAMEISTIFKAMKKLIPFEEIAQIGGIMNLEEEEVVEEEVIDKFEGVPLVDSDVGSKEVNDVAPFEHDLV